MNYNEHDVLFEEGNWSLVRNKKWRTLTMVHTCKGNGYHPLAWTCTVCGTSVPESIKTLALFARQNNREIRPLNS